MIGMSVFRCRGYILVPQQFLNQLQIAGIAQQTRCAVVLAACERLGIGQGWRLHLERMHEPPTPQALNEAMQRMILRWPTQYLWGYNRYKRPQGPA